MHVKLFQRGVFMKKVILVFVVAFCFLAGSALASPCDYHQWRPCYAKDSGQKVAAGYGNMCKYHQWRKAKCKDAPVAKAAPAPTPEKIVLEGVYFDTGSAKIKSESYSILDSNATKLMKKKDMHATIVGYTDNVGSPEKNKRLSEARAVSVKEYLTGKGVDGSRLGTKGMGQENPIADNSTKEGRAKNRRIEMELK